MRYTFVPRKTRVHSIRIVYGWIVVKEPTLDLQSVSRIHMLYCRNWAKFRLLPQKEVFGVYLARYTFVPRKTRLHSIHMIHGHIVVKEPTLKLRGESRNHKLYCRNWAKIRRSPQKEVFGEYLDRYSFLPQKSGDHSIRLVHC